MGSVDGNNEASSSSKDPVSNDKLLSEEDLELFETTEAASEVIEYDPDDPFCVSQSSFDWDNGRYFKGKVWLTVLLQVLAGIILTLIGFLLYKKFDNTVEGYSFWIEKRWKFSITVEVTRGFIQVGIPFLGYALTELLFVLVPHVAMAIAKARGKSCPGIAVRLRVEHLLKLRRSIGMIVFGIAASFLSLRLYPRNTIEGSADEVDYTKTVLSFRQDLINYFTMHHRDFFITRFFIAWLVIAIIVFCENAFILQIGVTFHAAGLAKREKANQFFRKVTQALCKYFVESGIAANPISPPGELIFDAIGKPKVNVKDFMTYMDEDEAELYFLQLDEEGGGQSDLNRAEFIDSVTRLQNEEKAIEKALLNTSGLIGKVDRILMVLVVILSSILALAIFEPPIAIIISYFVSILASFVFLFGSTVKTLFDSIMYIIVNHPFDQDDWLALGNAHLYRVKEIGLLTSTFLSPQNDLVYINNLSLNSQAVVNITRSGSMCENIKLTVLPETNKAKLAQLEQACQGWLRNHPHLFLPQLSFSDFQVTDSLHMRLNIRLNHRANFDDMAKKNHRSRLFMLFLKETMGRLGIQASPPVLPSSVKPFIQ